MNKIRPRRPPKQAKRSKISATSAHNHREGGGEAPAPAPNHYHDQVGWGPTAPDAYIQSFKTYTREKYLKTATSLIQVAK